ncbi:hypothetical protein JVU11DRAFT_9600 [Chiua virens]|nr:hypothetical protein JVU11DRAFT_9600 [Chiua virens]
MNQQPTIESQFVSKLADNLNAEIVLGTVRNRDETICARDQVLWAVRCRWRLPGGRCNGLVQKHADIIHSVAALLEKCHLVKYERASGQFQSTELDRIASH